jgi:undecaprenyl-diphosphatase
MTELAFDGSNPDVGLLYNVNDLARHAPGWLDDGVRFLAQYGLVAAAAVLAVCCWWRVARRQGDEAPSAVAGALWSVLSAGIALLLSVPIRGVVQRPRPFEDHQNLYVLLRGTSKFSFVNDHSTLTMAVGVGLFMVHRKIGLAGMGIAAVEGFTQVFMGVNYPTDVVGGLALGAATALLLAPLAMLGLVPLADALSRGRAAVLVRPAAPQVPDGVAVAGRPPAGPAAAPACDKDLAA